MNLELKDLTLSLTNTFYANFNLYFATHSAHWNIEGIEFYAIHKMLEEQYKDMQQATDDIAEKIRQLGAYAPSDLKAVANGGPTFSPIKTSSIHSVVLELFNYQGKMIEQLASSIEFAKAAKREDLVNYLASRWEEHGKMRWMLRATAKQFEGK